MYLYIKYMVSQRCKLMVENALSDLQIKYNSVQLGMVAMPEPLSLERQILLKASLLKCGLDLLDDKKSILIERIKNVIVDMIHHADELPRMNYSDYISDKLQMDYTYLSNIFSEVKGITIQQFIINHKVEKIKELLLYGELNMTEISYQLHYSSVAHLSNQFKKVTGLSPSFYKKMKQTRRSNLEEL